MIIAAPLKKGPKGICDLRPFLPKITKNKPMIAPLRKAKNKAKRTFGQPRIKPIRKANLTSPKPIHLPLEIRTSDKKKPAARRADNRYKKNKLDPSASSENNEPTD